MKDFWSNAHLPEQKAAGLPLSSVDGMVAHSLKIFWRNPLTEGWHCPVVHFFSLSLSVLNLIYFFLSTFEVAFLMFKFAPALIKGSNHQELQKDTPILVAVLDNVKIPHAV